ncbi:MAG: RNA 3'-terminal phosphate cyclase, partial [Candidatus Nanoarchaeia archaeon]
DVLGARGKQSEEVGEEAASALVKEIKSGAAVDPYLADNLIPFLAVFGGKMKMSSITEHTKTNMWVCEQFLGKCFEVEGNVISAEMIRPG